MAVPGVSRRALLLYLGAIVGPTLVLLALGFQSVYRQRQALDQLTLANLRLSGERVAAEVERRVLAAMEACLRDPRLGAAVANPASFDDPAAARSVRKALDEVRRSHPIASSLIVLQSGRVRFPRLAGGFPATIEALIQAEPIGARPALSALFEQAEAAERSGRVARASRGYARCSAVASTPALRASSMLREAYCQLKQGDTRGAIRLYEDAAARFPDEFDPSGRPVALVASLERLHLSSGRDPASPAVARLLADLRGGRWEVDGGQLAYFDAQLRGFATPDVPGGWFAAELQLAEAFEREFQVVSARRPGEVVPFAFSVGGRPQQAYYGAVGRRAGAPLVAAVVDAGQLAAVVAASAWAAGVTEPVSLVARRAAAGENQSRLAVAFPSTFPSWSLSISAPVPLARLSRDPGDLLLFAGATLLIMTVLVLGVVLLARDVARESAINRLRGDFVSGVSHELKTPLTVIRLYAENLLDDPDAPAPARRHSYEVLTRESERLTRLVERVLQFSRVEREAVRYELQPLSLPALVAEVAGIYGQHLRRKGFRVELSMDHSIPFVQGDRDAIEEAVVNLIDNAAKYSGDSRYVRVAVGRRADSAVVEVEDRGPGIPAPERERVFERFYRSPGTPSGGYGLGLFLVAHTMKAHSGRVELESEPGRGTSFRLVFPLAGAVPAQGA